VLGAKELRGAALPAGVAFCALLALLVLSRPAPLFVNFGAGDEPYARGFRPGWERDGLTGSGATMFHWTQDGARLELPFEARGETTLRVRLARFSDTPAEMTLVRQGQVVERWTQAPRGWSERRFTWTEDGRPLSLQFRSESADGLGVALDWAELRAERAWPVGSTVARLLATLVILPLVVGLALGARAGSVASIELCVTFAAGAAADRLAAVEAFARGGLAAIVVALLVLLLHRLLRRFWPKPELPRAAALVAALGAASATLVLSHPFLFYPDSVTHGRFLAAVRSDPSLLWDATPYQEKTGTWAMREVAGRKVAFPYSPAFHALALPLAPLLGDEKALEAVAAASVGLSLLLVFSLARAAGLGPGLAGVAQALFVLWPVTLSRLSLALYPTLLGQAMDLLLLVGLARLSGASPRRDATVAFGLLLVAQLAYTGSLFNTALLVGLYALFELAGKRTASALRLLAAYGLALGAVLALQYARFLGVLVREVLPAALARTSAAAAEAPASVLVEAWQRFSLFYGPVVLVLAALGVFGLTARAPRPAYGLVFCALAAGALLLFGRYLAPGLLRDAKEIELMAPSLAVCAAAGLGLLWTRGVWGRLGVALFAIALVHLSLTSAVAVAAARLVAIGRA
jgi:hypothetical protein